MAQLTSKENIRISITTGFFVLIVVAAGATIWLDFKVPPEIILSVVGGYSALYFGLTKHWMEKDKMFKDLFEDFNARFNSMNDDLNKIRENKQRPEGSRPDDEVIQAYLNLCSEEYLWFKRGRIDAKVWRAWLKGAEYYLGGEKIRDLFEEESKENESYYGLFDVLKIPPKKENNEAGSNG